MKLDDRRIRVIVGHYGSGKTEFSINYALALRGLTTNVTLCDLDIVNPYFRSREKAAFLEEKGIHVISGARGHQINLDVPMIASDILMPLENQLTNVILDVGGDDVGARVLARYKHFFVEDNYDMFCIINANRAQTRTSSETIRHIKKIEETVGVKVTGLINNTHLLRETQLEDIIKGQDIALEVSLQLSIPIKYTCVLNNLIPELPDEIEGEILPIHLIMREAWM